MESHEADEALTAAEAAVPVEVEPEEAEPEHVTAVMPLRQSSKGGSGSFLVRTNTGERCWCKTVNNEQSKRVPVNEQIVGRLGEVIGVAVCSPRLVEIPDHLAGWEFRPGKQLEAGWAHGSLAVKDAEEIDQLEHRGDDDNARRHAGFFALYDWLHGDNPQWLRSTTEANAYYQHDNGHYFPGGPDWTPESLRNATGNAHQLGQPTEGLDRAELERLAKALEELTREEIASALTNMESVWGLDPAEVEAMIDFADARRADVAARLRSL